MQDTGLKWLGEIPSGWALAKIGGLYSIRNEKVSDKEYPPLSVTNKGILPQLETAAKTNDGDNRKLVRVGDFAINSRSDRRGSCGISSYDGSVSLINIVMVPRKEMVPTYYEWLFHTTQFGDENYRWGHGIVDDLWTTGWQEMKKITIPMPPLNEQRRIADYLDAKCAEIDSLTADIQTQIDTLEQYKRSVITEAVTKGLNPDVEMAYHQISWIEQMPAHWKIIPSKYLFHNSDKRKCEGDQQLTASQKHGIITQQEYMERENSKIVFANQGLENWKHVEPYDFVISLRSFQGGLEMSETTGCITWHYVVLKASKPICPRFYKWLFKSSAYINALQGTCNFIRDGQDLRFSNFAQVPLYEPPLSEQEDIASYLDMKCSQIDSISDQKKEQLTVLEAYKKSLIYEYVTGKKEVPVQ